MMKRTLDHESENLASALNYLLANALTYQHLFVHMQDF